MIRFAIFKPPCVMDMMAMANRLVLLEELISKHQIFLIRGVRIAVELSFVLF